MDPDLPQSVVGDKKRFIQVLNILLSNAIKFTGEQGSIQIKASAPEHINETVSLRFEVIDNGIGISKEQQEVLFALFEQADGGECRQFGGVGSGLFIAKHIVEMMGGQLWVESEPGCGSKFVFTMKAKISQSAAQDNPVNYKDKTVLLVDDIEINRDIAMAMLESTEINIECAENGTQAVEMFESSPDKYDMIFMDVQMPGMSGPEVTRRIRNLGILKGAQVPIVALTANVHAEDVDDYFASGMNDHVAKPVDIDKLKIILNKYLGVNKNSGDTKKIAKEQ